MSHINIYEIAKITGFSPTTVSKVINDYPDVSQKTRELIQNVMKEHNYMPNSNAQALSTKRTKMIGIVYEQGDEIGFNHPFFGSVLQFFKEEAQQLGYSLLFGCKTGQDNKIVDYLVQKRVDGVLLLSTCGVTEEIVQLVERNIPVVGIDLNDKKISNVSSDNTQGMRDALRYLADLGHVNVGIITAVDGNWISDCRKEAFEIESQKLNLNFCKDYVQEGYEYGVESGKYAIEKLMSLTTPPTAVCCMSDEQAIGVMQALTKLGYSVPEDVSVIGFDNVHFSAYVTPALTTISQNAKKIGVNCARTLYRQIQGEVTEVSDEIIPVELIVRESCAKPKI